MARFSKRRLIIIGFFGIAAVICVIGMYNAYDLYTRGIRSLELLQRIVVLELTGFDENEKILVESVTRIDSGLIPSDVRELYFNEDISSIQINLVESVLADGKVSDNEVTIISELEKWNRWWIVRDIYNSRMIDDTKLQQNWDSDARPDGSPLSNYEEIMQGTNPLESLETSPDNLSERYVVMTNVLGWEWTVEDTRKICEMLVRNGYNDDNIYLTLNPGIEGLSNLLYSLVDHMGNAGERYTAFHFLNNLKYLPSDENDRVLVYSSSHGNINTIGIGRGVSASELNGVLYEMNYGTAITVIDCSHAGGFVSNLINNPHELQNMLGISSQSFNESSTNHFIRCFVEYLDSGFSVKESFEKAKYDMSIFRGRLHPGIHFGSAEDFTNPLVYLREED